MRPIEYIDYDKISDDVLYLGDKLYLRMNVSLSSKKDPDMRYHFHQEFEYPSPYGRNGYLRSIKRSFTYFLSLDRKDISGGGRRVRDKDMFLLKEKLKLVTDWFGDNTFGTKKKNLIIKTKREPIILPGLANQKYLQFDPIVIVYESTGEQTPGVRITLGDSSIFADISVDKLFSFKYTIDTFNMYLSAQLLINYLGRPEFGTGLRVLENNEFIEDHDTGASIKNKRDIPNKKPKSFFDKMDDMMKED